MKSSRFEVNSFSLAKGKELISEDFAEVRVFGEEFCIGVLCDGVGSAREGARASRRVVNYLINNFKQKPKSWSIEKSLRKFINSINQILYKEGIDEYGEPEFLTTLSIVVVDGDRLYGANVGDSPIWLFRDKKLELLSTPHNLKDEGLSNVLTQAIGMSESVEPYFFENNLQKGDLILLASDGLEAVFDEEKIKSEINFGALRLIKSASKAVDDNLPDDTTAVTIKIKDSSKISKLKNTPLPIPQTLKKNQIIDGYTLLRPLIANERTWLVQKKGVKYILKFPPVEAIYDEEFLDLFVKEAWNGSRLKAGFFPKAVIPKNRTQRYYLMRYIEGERLDEYIKRRKLSIDDAIALCKFLLRASVFLLKYDLVHGDIKPENIIIINRNGKLSFKLIDFGSIVEIFSISSKAGTPSYLSPERFQKEPISQSSEIFAIGVTLYQALSQKYPYGEIEPFQTPTFKPPKPLSKINPAIPSWFESVVMRAVEADRERRYSLYSEMEYELNNPQKVKPYYPKNLSLIEKEPEKVYRWLFILSFLLNLILAFMLLGRG